MQSYRACVLLIGLVIPQNAFATADFHLSEQPEHPTLQSCRKWAASQKDTHTLRFWGRIKSGATSRDIAILRLTLSCLGDETPEIVMFGSSAGFDDAYCSVAQHKSEEICKKK